MVRPTYGGFCEPGVKSQKYSKKVFKTLIIRFIKHEFDKVGKSSGNPGFFTVQFPGKSTNYHPQKARDMVKNQTIFLAIPHSLTVIFLPLSPNKTLHMKNRLFQLTALLFLCNSLMMSVSAQMINLNDMPPFDPKVRTGVLDNGMRYFIRSNKLPEKRGEFYIAHNVGAIQEDDDQNGLAHFTEHMAFNGTANFPGKGILNYLATIGVKFGTNVNAGTGLERTVYNLSNVPLTREGIIDSCLLILHDWSNYISFDTAEIDLERGVIIEEWRMYGSASERMSNELAPIVYKGSKYANRNVIGDTAVLKHFRYQTIRNFYKKWYRPDLQAVVVIGDFDENLMEAKIKKLFGAIPAVANPTPKERYDVPDNTEPLIGVASDKEATSTMVDISFKHNAVSEKDKNLNYMRTMLIRNLINTMFGQRMAELADRENPPFIFARTYYGQFTSTRDAFSGMAQAANNQSLKALSALLTEMERMKLYGFTQGEFDRAKAELLRQNESRYMDRNKRKNRELVYPNIAWFMNRTPNPGIEFEYSFNAGLIPGIGLDEVNQTARGYVTQSNMIVTVTGPEKQGVTLPTTDEIKKVIGDAKKEKIEPYVDNVKTTQLVPGGITAGKVIETTQNGTFETTEWKLSNGIRVVIKPTDIKEDELIIRGFSAGGMGLVSDDLIYPAQVFSSVVNQMGLGEFSRSTLTKMLAGKKANLMAGIGSDQEMISSRTSPKDLEAALQLIYLFFTNPRWDATDFNTWLDKMKSSYINRAAEPRSAFSDSIAVMMGNHHPRAVPLSYNLLGSITLDKVKQVYAQRFSDPSGFTFIFVGKINPEEQRPMIEKYLGSLPAAGASESPKDDGVRPPAGKVTNDFSRENKTPRTSVFVNFNGKCDYTPLDKLLGATLRHILELRYTESIREDEGGTYSVRTSWNLNKYPEPGYLLNVTFDTDPAKADKLIEIVHREINRILEKGPTDIDLQKAREYLLKQRPEDRKENSWWSAILLDQYFNNLDYLSGYEKMVMGLTLKSIHEYAKKMLNQGNEVQVIMRPL